MFYNKKKINFINPPMLNPLTAHVKSVGFCNAICPDQVCGTLTKNNNNITISLSNRNQISRIYDVDYNKITKGNFIVFILESPHIDEFNNGVPVGPAIGTTGRNIASYLNIVINNSSSFYYSLQNNIKYSLIIVNAVQYQASQGIKPLDRNLTDKNWIYFWNNNFKKDLIDRINEIIKNSNDYKIINLCTIGNAGLHFFVNEDLRENGISFYEGYHPCNWTFIRKRKIW